MAGVYRHARGVLPPGARIGRFELIRRLARGGMAEIYLARALGIHGFEKLVVLKLVLAHLAEDRQFVDMFLGEARLAATLDHPNIVHVTDIGEVGGEPFYVMEYVHGQDLRSVLRTCAKKRLQLPLPVALTTVAGAAAGLNYVHQKRDSDGRFLGLVHRDVSPSNVMLSYEGGIKLVDFGIAKATEVAQATQAGVLKGKVNYMAPEQCDGKALDRRIDVFALGIMLYETTTGRRLFSGDNDFHVMSRIVRGVFARPSEISPHYPAQLEKIILRALATDPDDRYPSAQDLLRAVESFAQEERISLSTLEVAGFLRELFGDQPLPTADDEDDASPTALHPDARSAVKSRHRAAETRGTPAATGVADDARLKATGLVVGKPEATLSMTTTVRSDAEAPTRVVTGGVDEARIPNPMASTLPSPKAGEMTVITAAVDRTLPTPGVDPLPRRPPTGLASVDDSGPLAPPPAGSRWWVGLTAGALVIGAVWLVAVSTGEEKPAPLPRLPAAEVVPAAAADDGLQPPVQANVTPPVSPGESPGRTETPGSLAIPSASSADPSPDEIAIIETDGAEGQGLGVPEGSAPDDSAPSRPKHRRPKRKRSRSSKKSSGAESSPGLDAMYPGGKP